MGRELSDKPSILAIVQRNGGAFIRRASVGRGSQRPTMLGGVMRTIKGPGLFLAQFARDTPPHNTLEGIARWAKNYGYKAIQIPTWDRRFFDLDRAYESEAYCDEIKGRLADVGIAISELSTPFSGPDGLRPSGLRCDVRRPMPRAGARRSREAAPLGGRSGAQGGQGVATVRPERTRELHRLAGLAVFLSLSAAPGRPDRGLLRRAGAPLEADPRRLRRERRRPLLRDSPDRGHFRRRHVRDVPGRGRRTPALQHQLRREPLHQAMHGLSRLHRRLSRAHQDVPRQGRRIQPDREAGRLRRLSGLAASRRARPLARRRSGRISRPSSPSSPATISRDGRSTSGSAACSIRKSRRARARSSSPTTSSK